MIACPSENVLARLLDATLSDLERGPIEQHLDACSECSHLVAELVRQVAPAESRYQLRAELGRGGMGRVVEASDPVLGRIVAVKEALADDADSVRRFARETRITARLEHPSIVPVYDAGTAPDGTPFYVMRKVSGEPLAQLVAATASLVERLALVPHVVAAAHAIAHAHERGIVHRDLKPSNILTGDNGETVVIDWGLAKVVGDPDDAGDATGPGGSLRTRIGVVFGTPGFMAPEQARGEQAGTRGDVYALGATLYYVIAKQAPHAGGSEDDMLAAAAAGRATPIAQQVAGVPPELAAITDKALAFDAPERYADARALADDLQRFLTGQLITAHRYSTRERIVRFVKRHRAAVAVAMIAVVAIAIGSWLAVGRVVRERDRADRHAREAEQRADDLIVLQAEALVKSNPTVAVALVKQLRSPPERWQRTWRAARAVAAGARSQGVAWALPAPTELFTLAMSRSGDRAAATDKRGVVWIYDLPGHTARRLDAGSPRHEAVLADDDHVVTFQADRAIVIDLATGTERGLAGVADLARIEATPATLWWSSKGAIYRTDLATGTTTSIATATDFAVSPDQHWLAILAGRTVRIVDTTSPATHALVSAFEPELVAWAADSEQLAVMAGGRLGTAARGDASITWHAPGVAGRPLFAGSQLFVGSSSLDIVDGGVRFPSVATIELGAGLSAAFGDYAIVENDSVVHAIGHGVHVVLEPPSGSLSETLSVPAGPYVIAAAPGHVFVWDLREVTPAPARIPAPMTYAAVGDHDLLTWSATGVASWRDAALPDLPPARVVAASRDLAVAIALGASPTAGYAVTKTAVTLVDADMVAGVLRTPDEVVAATGRGAVIRASHGTVFQRAARIDAIGAAGAWIAAAYANGLVVRRNIDTGVESELHAEATGLLVLPDGRVCFPTDARIACWRPDGTLVTAFALPAAASSAAAVGERLLVAAGSSIYAADVAHDRLIALAPADAPISLSAELAVLATASGQIDAIDLASGARWQVVQPGPRPIRSIALAPDGSAVFGIVDAELVTWPIAVPPDADATARWLDRLTNGAARDGVASLAWP